MFRMQSNHQYNPPLVLTCPNSKSLQIIIIIIIFELDVLGVFMGQTGSGIYRPSLNLETQAHIQLKPDTGCDVSA